MLHHKKIGVVLSLAGLMVIGLAATRPADDKPPKMNLKVLPKDISHEDLEKTMHNWSNALGVHCNFCHAAAADSASHKLDFASDAKPEKNAARYMFKMTARINKKFFHFNKNDANAVPAISCVTCHRGSPHPDEAK